LLLHSGAHKNDLITAAFSAGALFWSARWCAQRATPAFILAVLCGSLAIGTKMTAATVVVALVPFVLATLISSPPPLLAMLKGVVFVAISLLLLGGWVYMMNATAPAASPYAAVAAAGAPAGYGDWRNLWELPLAVMQVSAGFTTPWPWSKYNIYKSHFGALFSIAVIALPFCVWRYRRVAGRDSVISLAAAVLAFGLILPAVHPPAEGTAILRYAAFILPFVLAWTVAPVAREQRRYAVPILSLLIALFVWQSVDVAINDTFAPFDYVVDSASRGVPPVASRSHAAYQLDRMAGATDTVAAYGPTVWLYPAYGANFTRHVTHVPTAATASAVPRHAQWVLIDWLPSTARHPSAEELAFYNDMRRDSRFALAYRDEYRNQAIFRRLR
jgi:hypothetical protein